jgi:hypothetical protein
MLVGPEAGLDRQTHHQVARAKAGSAKAPKVLPDQSPNKVSINRTTQKTFGNHQTKAGPRRFRAVPSTVM